MYSGWTQLAAIEERNLNVIVGVSYKGGPIELREFGAVSEDGISPEARQVDINSITKTVTGVMAAKLVQQGKAKLDETLENFFENVPEDKSGITLHQLLTHSAGFRHSVGQDFERLDRNDFLARALQSDLESAPGEKYEYSNVGYGIVTAIIETRSDKSYERYLHEDVIAGLELKDTGYASVYDENRSLRTKGGETIEKASWGGYKPYWNLIGNGGLISTAQDMIRFRQAVISGEAVSQKMLEIIQTPHIK